MGKAVWLDGPGAGKVGYKSLVRRHEIKISVPGIHHVRAQVERESEAGLPWRCFFEHTTSALLRLRSDSEASAAER